MLVVGAVLLGFGGRSGERDLIGDAAAEPDRGGDDAENRPTLKGLGTRVEQILARAESQGADRIADATAQSARIIADAQAEAARIVAEARAEADRRAAE